MIIVERAGYPEQITGDIDDISNLRKLKQAIPEID
jgi:hypothetical protein|tara:strand:+ start:240 stop:344 length:105 start_codon:yes stop_codon:yes gene_type:complete